MTSQKQRFEVLFEDNHLLVLNKPAGWIVQGAQPNDLSLLEEAKNYIGQKYNKPGNVYVGVVSRLDRDVTGVLPLARTSKAAARLNAQFQNRTVDKIYWAIVQGRLMTDEQRLHHWLTRDEHIGKTNSHGSNVSRSQEAILSFRRLASREDCHWLEIKLETGRKHQIRSQLESIGCPIIGDKRYGSQLTLPAEGIALHCRAMTLEHPTLKHLLRFEAELPSSWRCFDDFDNLPSSGKLA